MTKPATDLISAPVWDGFVRVFHWSLVALFVISVITGKVGDTVDLDTGVEAARMTALSILATMRAELGDLDRVRRIVKVFGMVNVAPGFNRTPQVIDGCSDLLVDVFGEAGRHTRSAVGLAELPFDIAVEIELIAAVD